MREPRSRRFRPPSIRPFPAVDPVVDPVVDPDVDPLALSAAGEAVALVNTNLASGSVAAPAAPAVPLVPVVPVAVLPAVPLVPVSAPADGAAFKHAVTVMRSADEALVLGGGCVCCGVGACASIAIVAAPTNGAECSCPDCFSHHSSWATIGCNHQTASRAAFRRKTAVSLNSSECNSHTLTGRAISTTDQADRRRDATRPRN